MEDVSRGGATSPGAWQSTSCLAIPWLKYNRRGGSLELYSYTRMCRSLTERQNAYTLLNIYSMQQLVASADP